jgi:type II secretory pathway component GspD/PulD (secretin)
LIAWALVVFCCTLAATDETIVEVLTVRNRPAADLVNVLQPFAGRDGVVAVSGDKLVVRATPAALAQIKQVLRDLDVAPRALWITVEQGIERSSSSRSAEVTGVVKPGSRSKTVATGAFGGGSADEKGSDVQRLQVLEGSRAFIRVGTAVPVPQAVIVPTEDGTAIVPGTAYQNADTGFWVVPRVAGDVVTLEISTRRDTPAAGGTIEIQHVDTTVSGRLGEWLSIGGIGRSESSRSRGILGGSSQESTEDRTVTLKVEEAR